MKLRGSGRLDMTLIDSRAAILGSFAGGWGRDG